MPFIIQAFRKPSKKPRIFKAMIDEDMIGSQNLEDFASSNSLNYFKILRIDTSFLKIPIDKWTSNTNYCEAKRICSSLNVVNDSAERGVALINEFNSALVNDESQKQGLLQVVAQNRKQIPKITKKEIQTYFDK